MNTPPPEKRRVKISTGTTPSSEILSLAACHPFSQQLDVVFPSNTALFDSLRGLEAVYAKGTIRLGDIVNNTDIFANLSVSCIVCTKPSNDNDDVWCIDPRGHLTLSVSTNTYERLGLLGQTLPFKNQHDRHVIDIPLKKNTQSVTNQAKQKKALEDWDARRENELGKDSGLWNIVYHCNVDSTGSSKFPIQGAEQRRVQCKAAHFNDLVVPTPTLRPRPSTSGQNKKTKSSSIVTKEEEDQEDWDMRTQSLFEWVGMASLGAQRLRANDRVDPFVAVYEPPEPSTVQNVTHLRWCGLLNPTFINQVIDTVITSLQNSASASTSPLFVGLTCQTLSSSPVSYIPYTVSAAGVLQTPTSVPARLPRKDGEDCWSLIVEHAVDPQNSSPDQAQQELSWCLAESIGRWDARWG